MKFSTIFIFCFLFCTNLFSQAILTDNFDNLNNWTLYGSPLPNHISSIFGKTGVFDNNGDGWYNSGAISKQTYNISTGFILESEVYLNFSNLNGCWASAEIGIANPAYQSWGGYDSYISLALNANGEACWGSPAGTRRRAIISGGYKTSTGWETIGDLSTAPIYADQYANSWQILKIVVDQNRMPKFYISNTLIYTGTQPIDATVMSTNRAIWLGARSSGSAGKAYHDWVKLSTYTTTNLSLRVLPVARISLIDAGLHGVIMGFNIVSGIGTASLLYNGFFGALTSQAMNQFIFDLELHMIQEVTQGLTKAVLNTDPSNPPTSVVICFKYDYDKGSQINVSDVLYLLETNSKKLSKIGHPYEITYSPTSISFDRPILDAQTSVGNLVSSNTISVTTNNGFPFKSIKESFIQTSQWLAPNISMTTVGIVSGYDRTGGRDYMILQDFYANLIFINQIEMTFMAVDVTGRTQVPSVGSVVKVEGSTIKVDHVLKIPWEYWYTPKTNRPVMANSINILNGNWSSKNTIGNERLFRLFESKEGQSVNIIWPQYYVSSPDFVLSPIMGTLVQGKYKFATHVSNEGSISGKCQVTFDIFNVNRVQRISTIKDISIIPGSTTEVQCVVDPLLISWDPCNPVYLVATVSSQAIIEKNIFNNIRSTEVFFQSNEPPLIITAYCPVYIDVSSSDGRSINPYQNDFSGATYLIDDFDDNGTIDHRVVLQASQSFTNLSIRVVPEDNATPSDSFSIIVRQNGLSTVLVDQARISDIPVHGYTITSPTIQGKVLLNEKRLGNVTVDLPPDFRTRRKDSILQKRKNQKWNRNKSSEEDLINNSRWKQSV